MYKWQLEVEILTAKRALLQTQRDEADVTLWSHASEQRSQRRRISRQQQDEVSVREQRGKKMYSVNVDTKGNPVAKTVHFG